MIGRQRVCVRQITELTRKQRRRGSRIVQIAGPGRVTGDERISIEGNKMTAKKTGTIRLVFTWILRCLLGLAFLGIGIEKLTGTMGTIPFFAAIGWGQWFRYASGALDTLGALLIFVPRWTSYGALIITGTVGLGTVLCFTMAIFNPIFPLVMTLLAATLAWLAWRPKPA